jgi:dienelactone hydrolase
VVVIACAGLAAIGGIARPYVAAAAFITDLSGTSPWFRPFLPVRQYPVTTRDLDVPSRRGSIVARLYRPASGAGRTVVVFPGIHAGGVDEPRLDAFARRLAATGLTVLSVPLPELRRYLVTPASTDAIEDVVSWVANDGSLAPSGRVSIAGVSFAGGLAIVAAGRPALRGKVDAIVSLGGHADLPRVMRFLCTGRLPDGTFRRPHDYGVAVILLGALPVLVPAEQVGPAEAALRQFLDASSAQHVDPELAAPIFEAARALTRLTPEPARTLLEMVNARDVAGLGARLLPHLEALGGAAALSPDRSDAPHVPVFLLHGRDDNLIPSSETPALAAYLKQEGDPDVRWLLTPLLSHADVKAATLPDAWRLMAFWKQVLGAERRGDN